MKVADGTRFQYRVHRSPSNHLPGERTAWRGRDLPVTLRTGSVLIYFSAEWNRKVLG